MAINRVNAMINNSPTIIEKLGANIESPPHKVVMYDANGDVVIATAGDVAIGAILSNTWEPMLAGQEVSILIKNIGLVEAGAAISKGTQVTVNTEGQVIPAVSGDGIFGRAFTAASAPGEVIQVQINNMGYKA